MDEPGLSWQVVLLSLIVCCALADVLAYRIRKGKLPGPKWVTPFIGGAVEMVMDPVPFWERQIDFCRNGVSVSSLAGKFMAFITNSSIAHKVYTNTDDFILFAHPNAKYLFGEENLIYMDADVHKKVRALLIPGIYSKEALAMYLKAQKQKERVVRRHLNTIVAGGKEIDARLVLRLMTADASQEVFVGPYLAPEEKPLLAQEILTFTMGFLSAPIPLPGGGLWAAIKARNAIRKLIAEKAHMAEEYIRRGGPPRCVLDYWMREILDRDSADVVSYGDVATTILDFMFASQDATTSASVWSLEVLGRMPHIVERLRSEIAKAEAAPAAATAAAAADGCIAAAAAGLAATASAPVAGSGPSGGGESGRPFHEYFAELTFVKNCALEMLRFRPPVPMVPHLAKRRVELAPGIVVPKGAMVVPSVVGAAANEKNADVFDPDNLVDPNFNKVFTFGAGQHKCPGRMYASQLLTVFIGVLASEYSWERRRTERSDNIIYAPTLFPEDNFYTFKKKAC